MSRRLTMTSVNAYLTVIAGYGSRDLLAELRGRPPLWSSRPRGWATTPEIAADVAALAERRGFLVVHNEAGEVA